MRYAIFAAFALALASAAMRRPRGGQGLPKGAVVGGVAGHYAGHHGVMGAIGGCVVGHHLAHEKAKEQAAPPAQGEHGAQAERVAKPRLGRLRPCC